MMRGELLVRGLGLLGRFERGGGAGDGLVEEAHEGRGLHFGGKIRFKAMKWPTLGQITMQANYQSNIMRLDICVTSLSP